MPTDEPIVPDYTARIAGARSWRVANTLWARMGGLLWADAMLEPWPKGEEHEAACPAVCGDAPGEHCRCGIHGWFDYETMVKTWHPGEGFARVRGVVGARGGVWLHELGWRAQYATVEAIFDDVPDDALPIPKGEIAEAYGVPVIKPEEYADFCRERGLVLLRPE